MIVILLFLLLVVFVSANTNLYQGWNLARSPFFYDVSIEDGLSSIEGCYEFLFSYQNGTWKSYHPLKPNNTLDMIFSDYGYWLKINCTQTEWYCNGSTTPCTSEVCDYVDNDCDAEIDEGLLWINKGDSCTVGVGVCKAYGVYVCDFGNPSGPTVCSATAGSGSAEVCDGLDNDCDTFTDEGLSGTSCANQNGVCNGTTEICDGINGWLSCDDTVYLYWNSNYEPIEVSCDSLDNDCDGTADNVDMDGDGYIDDSCGGSDCDDSQAYVHPNATEICDSLDNDCNSVTDDVDRDNDGYIDQDCFGTDCNDLNPGINPGASEVCNGIDEDCDGNIDGDFLDLGDFCIVGTGICQASGTKVCKGDGTGTECSATPGTPDTEVCDYLDNDCDDSVDEPWMVGGKYTATDACGSCSNDCTGQFPNAIAFCDSSGAPYCDFNCQTDYVDLNGVPTDGCEFYLDSNVIYVSKSTDGGVDDSGCGLGPTGTGNYPCETISYGITRAVATGRGEVQVSDGLYQETVTLVNGTGVLGGYRADTWERHLSSTLTMIEGSSATTHKKTIIADGITSPTLFEGFIIFGQNNYASGGNSYGIYVKDCDSDLVIRDNVLWAGFGGASSNGNNGGDGSGGVAGNPGASAKNTNYSCYELCLGNGETPGGSGGARTCAGTNVKGGDGGTANCPDYDETINHCSACSGSDKVQTQTNNGANAPNSGGSGGTGGFDALVDYFCEGDCSCHMPTVSGSMDAGDGSVGSDGTHGTGGLGCSTPSGAVSGDEWVGSSGTSGTDGTHGRGGGGGGAGGGVETYDSTSCSFDGGSDIGGSGGGGGSGACGGVTGIAGGAGGGSFGIFIVFSSTPSSVPDINNNKIHLGDGGDGGYGGNGGAGGLGGAGAFGGAGGAGGTDYWCASVGGKGGEGGKGGYGGGAGGGCGGVSYGVYAYGQGGSDLSSWTSGNTFYTGGSAGGGGSGGSSSGNSGIAGQNGSQADTNF